MKTITLIIALMLTTTTTPVFAEQCTRIEFAELQSMTVDQLSDKILEYLSKSRTGDPRYPNSHSDPYNQCMEEVKRMKAIREPKLAEYMKQLEKERDERLQQKTRDNDEKMKQPKTEKK